MWSNFENSPLEDETISNIFSSRGMFKIRNEELIENYPNVQACVQNKHMVISIGKSFVLVEEDMETKCSFLSFNANVDAFAISQSGNLIICGLSNGEIHGVYIKGLPLFNVSIKIEDTPAIGKSFAAIQEIGRNFYLMCTNGSIYRLCEIDENALSKLSVTMNGNESVSWDESLLDYITVERLSNSRGLNDLEAAILINGKEDEFILIAGSDRFIFISKIGVNLTTRISIPVSYNGIKRIYYLDNYILMLTHSGHLLEVCPITKTVFLSSFSKDLLHIDDISIMESNDENIELLVLTKNFEDKTEETHCGRLMKFIQYPSLKCTNEFEVPNHSWIVQQPKCAVSLYYLRGQDINSDQPPAEVEMMSVSETHPSERFKKLIAKGHLEEAEDYGKHFELCLQPIYEAKAKYLLIQLCNLDENNPELLNQHYNDLLKSMDSIESREFFYNNRMINLPSRKITKKFLNYILKRFDEEHDGNHILEVLEQLRRLETLCIVDPYECDNEWQKFVYSSNLVKYLISKLKMDIPVACLIWKRHSAAIIPFLNQMELVKLLTLIPNNTEPFHLIQWLRQFVPIVSNTHPDTMSYITEWSIQKARALQYSEHWPDIGLEFSTKILEIIEGVEFMHFDVRRQYERNVGKLRELVNALQELSVLKKSYNLIFTLDSYQQESFDETAFCILQRCCNVKGIVNDFLYPIFHEQGKSHVGAIRRYINFLVASRYSLSTWLERAVTCIELLHDEDDRLECALIVLQCAPVPWPETVNPLIKLRFSTHPLALKISGEFEIQVIKIMKAKYGWPADSAMDINLNLFMLRILKMDLPDMLDDIRVLTKAAPEISTSANFNCCYQLVQRGKSEIAYEFFKTLATKKQNATCVNEIFEIFADLLENTELLSDADFIETQMNLIEFFKLITPKDCKSSQQRLQDVENRFILFKRFKVTTNTTRELVSFESRLKLLEAGIKEIIYGSKLCRTSNQNITKYFISEISELTAALKMYKIKGVRLICQQLKFLPLSCSLAYAVLEADNCNSDNKNDFINLALDLLAQQILADKSNQKSVCWWNDHLSELRKAKNYARRISQRKRTPENLEAFKKARANYKHQINDAKALCIGDTLLENFDFPEHHKTGWADLRGFIDLSTSTLNNEVDSLAFPLAYDLLVRASLYEKDKPLELSELLKYINISNMSYPLNAAQNYYGCRPDEINEIIIKYLNETESFSNGEENSCASFNASLQVGIKPEKKRESVSVFDEIEVQPQQPQKIAFATDETTIMKFVARTLLVLMFKAKPTNGFLLKLRGLLERENDNINVNDACKSFFLSLEQLVKIKVHDVWYTMAQYLLEYQQYHDCNIIVSDFVTLQLSRVFRNLMTQADCNFIDLFAILVSDNHTDFLFERLEHDLKTDQQRFNFLTLLQMYNAYLGEEQQVEAIRSKRLKHYYYMEFCKQDPTIKGKFNIDFDNIDKLLREFRNKQLDVYLLERISRDFDLDLEHTLIMQIISILQSQDLQYETKTDSFGEEELIMITTVEQIRALCQPYIDKIKTTELLTAKLKQFIAEINIYFYELYLVVIEILSSIDTVPKEMQIWTSILHFLKHKLIRRRRNRPGQLEMDIWLQSQSEIGILPKIARYRLPFKPIVEQPLKDILDNELSVDNCESWFPLIDLHTMLKGSKEVDKTRDYFCMTAIKNSITEYKAKNDTEIWHIQPTNNAFLKSILRLIQHVKNPSKVFTILYFVSSYAPEGADQVEATYECYKYALANEKHISDAKYQEQLVKIKRKYPILKTQHLLYVYGLADEKLLHMVENPTELIYKLYHHEMIVKPSKIDINSVVKEIALLHNINLEVIQFQLLQKWLSFTSDANDGTVLEETFLEDQHVAQQSNDTVENSAENVLRANYILNSWPKEDAMQFLVAHIFPVEGTSNTSKQLQVFECLSRLNDGRVSLQNKLSQHKYITVKCVHDLKQLGYNSSIEKFANCNKIDILKTIWQRNAQNPHTLEILANICLGYDIYLGRIWNGILKRMVMFNMIRELNALVDVLSCQPQLLHVDGLVAAWDYVLKHPFKNSNKTRSFEQEELLHKTLFRLQSCPVLEKLNLLEFAMLCTNLERPHMTAVLMTFSKDGAQREEIKKLIVSRKSEKLRKDILDLEDSGILPTILNYTLKELEL